MPCVPWEMKPHHGTVRDLDFGKEPLWAFGITLQFLLMPNFQPPGTLQGELTSECIRLDPQP